MGDLEMATEKEKEAFVGRSGATSSPRVHSLCQKRLHHAINKSECKNVEHVSLLCTPR